MWKDGALKYTSTFSGPRFRRTELCGKPSTQARPVTLCSGVSVGQNCVESSLPAWGVEREAQVSVGQNCVERRAGSCISMGRLLVSVGQNCVERVLCPVPRSYLQAIVSVGQNCVESERVPVRPAQGWAGFRRTELCGKMSGWF